MTYEEEMKVFNASWSLLKEYIQLERMDHAAWVALTERAAGINQASKGTRCETLARDMALAVLSHVGKLKQEATTY